MFKDSTLFNKSFFILKILFLFFVFQILFFKKINKIKPISINKPKPICIPIAFAINNGYTYPLIVLLASILYNSLSSTLYEFNIMISYAFKEENKQKIDGICKKYNNCKIIFHNLGHKYQDWETNNFFYSKEVYFRLSLPDLITDYDKIIYLDSDTMVHKDLTELYEIDMKDKYFMGFPGHEIGYTEINGTRNFINTGVILINLKSLRKINATRIFENYFRNYGTKKVDEYLINIIFYDKISFLPFKYGIPDFLKGDKIVDSPSYFWNTFNGYCNGTMEEMIEGSNNRIITHGAYTGYKWWRRNYNDLTEVGKKWIFHASKSNVFNEICNYYYQYQNICQNLTKN